MTPSWRKKEPTPDQVAVEDAVKHLEKIRERRKNLLQQVLTKIDDLPFGEALEKLGNDLQKGND